MLQEYVVLSLDLQVQAGDWCLTATASASFSRTRVIWRLAAMPSAFLPDNSLTSSVLLHTP